MRTILLPGVFIVLSGCITLPDVPDPETSVGETSEYPDFVPFDSVALDTVEAEQRNAETQEDLESRRAGLKERAEALRNREID